MISRRIVIAIVTMDLNNPDVSQKLGKSTHWKALYKKKGWRMVLCKQFFKNIAWSRQNERKSNNDYRKFMKIYPKLLYMSSDTKRSHIKRQRLALSQSSSCAWIGFRFLFFFSPPPPPICLNKLIDFLCCARIKAILCQLRKYSDVYRF